MIALASVYLFFETERGNCIPLSAEMISVELTGQTAGEFDSEFLKQASAAVFHYFKVELGRQTVTVGEYAEALEKVLRGFRRSAPPENVVPGPTAAPPRADEVFHSNLDLLAHESGMGCELFFFPRLRAELRRQLQNRPRVLRFHGLRNCAMRLAGAKRWGRRCGQAQEQIVQFLRECASAEAGPAQLSMVVEG